MQGDFRKILKSLWEWQEKMEWDRFLWSDPLWFFAGYCVYKFQSPWTSGGGEKRMIIISLKAAQLLKNQLQYKFTLYKMTFNILFLNISIKFYMIKNLFTCSFPLIWIFICYYCRSHLISAKGKKGKPLLLHIITRKDVKTRACH